MDKIHNHQHLIVMNPKLERGAYKEDAFFLYKEFFLKERGYVKGSIMSDLRERSIWWDEKGTFDDTIRVLKYNYISFTGYLIAVPASTVLFYGRRIYFINRRELSNFLEDRVLARLHELCPICGNPLGGGLRYTLVTGAGLPFNLFFCSKKCLAECTHYIHKYKKIFKELTKLIDTHYYMPFEPSDPAILEPVPCKLIRWDFGIPEEDMPCCTIFG